MVEVGRKVMFEPICSFSDNCGKSPKPPIKGTIVYVNEPHSHFVVQANDANFREGFKYDDIGFAVTLI